MEAPPQDTPPTPLPTPGERQKAARTSVEARARTLSAWRGIDLRPLETAQRRADKALSEILPNVLGRLRLDQRQSESQIVEVWKRTIDPLITAHAHPTALAKGTVFISVDSSVWLSEIVRYRQREILERLQLAVGKTVVQRLSFRIG
jgi:Dna[CI] antecedent, DciA